MGYVFGCDGQEIVQGRILANSSVEIFQPQYSCSQHI